MRQIGFGIAVLMLGLTTTASATIETLTASGTFDDLATLSGTVTIDNTTGVVTAVNLQVGPPFSFLFDTLPATGLGNGVSPPNPFFILAFNPTPPSDFNITFLELFVFSPTGTPVDYTGGPLCGVSTCDPTLPGFRKSFLQFISPAGPFVGGDTFLLDGALTLPTAVPEPSTIAMLGIGLAALGFRFRRRITAS